MTDKVVQATLADGNAFLMSVKMVDSEDGPSDVALVDGLPFSSVTKTIRSIADELSTAVVALKPTKAEVEFGLSVAIKGSKLACLVVDGQTSASIRLRLEWERKPDSRHPALGDAAVEVDS